MGSQAFKQEYPNECARCGFCCLSEVCPIGQHFLRLVSNQGRCPVLIFDENDVAVCKLAELSLSIGCPQDQVFAAFGFGSGCCIKARCFQGGAVYDFAGLPTEVKRRVVQNIRKRGC